MNIEAGKKYINALGEIVTVLENEYSIVFPFKSYLNDTGTTFESYKTYAIDGRVYIDRAGNYDLLCEVVPSILEEYEHKRITQKEMIEEHIAYYEFYNVANKGNENENKI